MSDSASACPKCGWKKKKTKWWLWIPLGLICAIFLYGGIASESPEAQAKARERDVIARCWEEQGRKSLDATTRQFTAALCEDLEQQFVRKHGFRP